MKTLNLPGPITFDWDAENINKNFSINKVTDSEAEQIFFNRPFYLTLDEKYFAKTEKSFFSLGKTNNTRKLFLVFRIREQKIRVISVRDRIKLKENSMSKLNQKRKLKPIPDFQNEDEEREFWASQSGTEYIDWPKGSLARFPNLKSSTETISLRLTKMMLFDLKSIANKKDIPYQSLIKIFLDEKIRESLRK